MGVNTNKAVERFSELTEEPKHVGETVQDGIVYCDTCKKAKAGDDLGDTEYVPGEPDEDGNVFDADGQAYCDGCGRRGLCEPWCPYANADPDITSANIVRGVFLDPDFLEAFMQSLVKTPSWQALVKTPSLRPGVKTGVGEGGLEVPSLPSFNVNVKGKECNEGNVKTPRGVGVLKSHLLPEVKSILEAAKVDSELIRYMDVMTGYSHVLNNPKSGDLNDAPRLLRSFVNKEGFETRFRQWLKNNPAPYDHNLRGIDPEME